MYPLCLTPCRGASGWQRRQRRSPVTCRWQLQGVQSTTGLVLGCAQTWKRICEASRNEFDAIYRRLDIRILWRGESFYNARLAPLVQRLTEQGTAAESEGAQVRCTLANPALCAAGGAAHRARQVLQVDTFRCSCLWVGAPAPA